MGTCSGRYNCLRILIFTLLLSGYFFVSTVAADYSADKDDIPEGLVLLPRIGVGIEYGGFIVHQDNYTSQLRRQLEVDLLQFRRHIFYVKLNENHFCPAKPA
jgi:hypothetical protein